VKNLDEFVELWQAYYPQKQNGINFKRRNSGTICISILATS
jgi:hypothetical protein